MTRLTTPLAVGADYHDALVAVRRAKSCIFLILTLFLLAQVAIFFVQRYQTGADVKTAATSMATSQPTVMASRFDAPLAWVTNSVVYLGTILSLVLPIILLLIILVMLCGRLLGVSHVISAFVWAVILAAVLFPWQNFYGADSTPAGTPISARDDFRIPGVLYTWGELREGVVESRSADRSVSVLKGARFVGFPSLAFIVLFMVQAKSGRGIKYALGEIDVQVDVSAP